MDIKLSQGDTIVITIQDDENPICGEITIDFKETFGSVYGWIKGPDNSQQNINCFVRR